MRFIFLYVVNKTIDKYGVGVILIVPVFINFNVYYIVKAFFISGIEKGLWTSRLVDLEHCNLCFC